MRVLESLFANSLIHRQIDVLGGRLRSVIRRCLGHGFLRLLVSGVERKGRNDEGRDSYHTEAALKGTNKRNRQLPSGNCARAKNSRSVRRQFLLRNSFTAVFSTSWPKSRGELRRSCRRTHSVPR